jgi:hypothetical protein
LIARMIILSFCSTFNKVFSRCHLPFIPPNTGCLHSHNSAASRLLKCILASCNCTSVSHDGIYSTLCWLLMPVRSLGS